MDKDEFNRQLDELHNKVLFDVLSYYTVWLGLWPTEDRVDVLNRYNGFFFAVRRALLDMLMLQSAKLFDRDSRTISFTNLIKAASENPDELIPHAPAGQVAAWDAQIAEIEELLEKLKHRRDQIIAHLDAHPADGPAPLKGEMDEFLEVVKSLYNSILNAQRKAFTSWDSVLNRAETSTSEVMRILAEDAETTEAAWKEHLSKIDVQTDT